MNIVESLFKRTLTLKLKIISLYESYKIYEITQEKEGFTWLNKIKEKENAFNFAYHQWAQARWVSEYFLQLKCP